MTGSSRSCAQLLAVCVVCAGSACHGRSARDPAPAGGDRDPGPTIPVPPPILPTPPAPAVPPPGTPADQAAYLAAQLADPGTRLSGWLGVYGAFGVPVIGEDGRPVTATGDDPLGPRYWAVWYAAGLDLPGRGLPLGEVAALIARTLGEPDGAVDGAVLRDDIVAATRSAHPQVQLLGEFVRSRVLRAPFHVDLLDPVASASAVIDLPTVQLIGWVVLRGALSRGLTDGTETLRGALMRTGGARSAEQVAPARPSCADFFGSSDVTTWLNFLINKVGGGFEVPGFGAFPGLIQRFQELLGAEKSTIERVSKSVAWASSLAAVLSLALAITAMEYSAIQEPEPLVRTLQSTYDGLPGVVALALRSEPGNIPNADELRNCLVNYAANALGVSLAFPPRGPIAGAEMKIEGGIGFPDLVLFDMRDSDMKIDRVTLGDDGQANVRVLGRRQHEDLPDWYEPEMKEYSIVVSAQPEEASVMSMVNIFVDGLSAFTPGAGMPAFVSGAVDILKTFHWKSAELVFRLQDWRSPCTAQPPSGVQRLGMLAASGTPAVCADVWSGTFSGSHGFGGPDRSLTWSGDVVWGNPEVMPWGKRYRVAGGTVHVVWDPPSGVCTIHGEGSVPLPVGAEANALDVLADGYVMELGFVVELPYTSVCRNEDGTVETYTGVTPVPLPLSSLSNPDAGRIAADGHIRSTWDVGAASWAFDLVPGS